MKTLADIILDECDLWKSLDTITEKVGGFEVYSTPNSRNAPFLNIAIPERNSRFSYEKEHLVALEQYFSDKERVGYIPFLKGGKDIKNVAAENSKYYHLSTVSKHDPGLGRATGLMLEETHNLELLANIVKLGFNFDDSFPAFFVKRIGSLLRIMKSKLFILKYDEVEIGCVSYFQRNKTGPWFMMNSCVLNEYRGNGHGKKLINDSIELLKSRDVCARTNNPNMEKLLESTGFLMAGEVSLISLRKLIGVLNENSCD